MPMNLKSIPGFCLGSYNSRARGVSACRTVNMRVERNSATSKTPYTLYARSGKRKFADVGPGPIHGAYANKTRVFLASGGGLYELFQDGTNNFLGNIELGTNPATMVANGGQLLICSAGKVFLATGTTIIQPIINFASGTVDVVGVNVTWVSGDKFLGAGGDITTGDYFTIDGVLYTVAFVTDDQNLVLTGAAPAATGMPYQAGDELLTGVMPAFIDGYFIVSKPNTKEFRISNLFNGAKWDALDVAQKSGSTDNIAVVKEFGGNLILGGDTNSTEIWADSGDQDFPFARVNGRTVRKGFDAPWSVAELDDGSLCWLACSDAGLGVVVRSTGGEPERISDRALENAIRKYSRIDDAIGIPYLEDGHDIYRIDFPTANRSWEWDRTENVWSEIGVVTDQDEVYGCDHGRYRVHVVWPNETRMALAGDFASPTVWEISPDFLDDDGVDFPVMRIAPYVDPKMESTNVKHFALDCELGEIDPSDVGPDGKPKIAVVGLEYSNDGANTWKNAGNASVGRSGEYEGTYLTPAESFDTTANSQTNPQVFECVPLWHNLGAFWISHCFKLKSTGKMLRSIYDGLIELGK